MLGWQSTTSATPPAPGNKFLKLHLSARIPEQLFSMTLSTVSFPYYISQGLSVL
jgi:hypothetical protein